MDAFERIADNADQFSRNLMLLSDALDADMETLIRLSVLDVFKRIVRLSPVDTGTYRASHGITTDEPSDDEGVNEGEFPEGGGKRGLGGEGWNEVKGWRWKMGDGVIYIFNNVPYAERIEDGHSKQAGEGVYAIAMADFNKMWQEELNKLDRLR